MTWGLRFFDADNDGDLDLAEARGHTMGNIELFESNLRYRQPNQLLENTGRGRFVDASGRAGAAWRTERVSRGLAVGDFDNDGRLDLLFTNTNDEVQLLAQPVRRRPSLARAPTHRTRTKTGSPSAPGRAFV